MVFFNQTLKQLGFMTGGAVGRLLSSTIVTSTGTYWVLANPHVKYFTKKTLKHWLEMVEEGKLWQGARSCGKIW